MLGNFRRSEQVTQRPQGAPPRSLHGKLALLGFLTPQKGVEMARIRLASDEECAVRNSKMAERGVSRADAYTQFVPNMGRLLSIRPEIGVPFGELFGVLMVAPGGLTRTQREMIAVVASRANRCFY